MNKQNVTILVLGFLAIAFFGVMAIFLEEQVPTLKVDRFLTNRFGIDGVETSFTSTALDQAPILHIQLPPSVPTEQHLPLGVIVVERFLGDREDSYQVVVGTKGETRCSIVDARVLERYGERRTEALQHVGALLRSEGGRLFGDPWIWRDHGDTKDLLLIIHAETVPPAALLERVVEGLRDRLPWVSAVRVEVQRRGSEEVLLRRDFEEAEPEPAGGEGKEGLTPEEGRREAAPK